MYEALKLHVLLVRCCEIPNTINTDTNIDTIKSNMIAAHQKVTKELATYT